MKKAVVIGLILVIVVAAFGLTASIAEAMQHELVWDICMKGAIIAVLIISTTTVLVQASSKRKP